MLHVPGNDMDLSRPKYVHFIADTHLQLAFYHHARLLVGVGVARHPRISVYLYYGQ